MIDRTFGHFVRVLVDLDLSQELRYKVLVERKGFAFFVDLDYENMPEFYNSCKIVGHNVGTCRRRYPNENQTKKDVEKKNDVRESLKGSEKGKEAWKEKNRVVVELEESPSSSKNQVGGDDAHADHTLENGLTMNEHSKVNSQDTKSLENEGEKEHTRLNIEDSNSTEDVEVKDTRSKQPSESLNKDTDDASSVASEFVDATQWNDQDEAIFGQEIATPARVLKDMQFLQESWANLAEKEDEEYREITNQIQKETEARTVDAQKKDMGKETGEEQGFQTVRRKKKKQISMSQGDRTVYATRSKDRSSQHSQ
ncbi:uncharacterized protein LOC131597718 [Vicia villosa]|uniref:uncharacterized protein LOC131597718 n=1 Tax=Vicia villosa TaxID=3911 RepID=UPI00273CD70A|nr:uncharacterized protein LOC131597718 [Vicia villosa]